LDFGLGILDLESHSKIRNPKSKITFLALLLFVLGVRADHAHNSLAADDLAVLTNASDTGADLHGFLSNSLVLRESSLISEKT